MQSVKTDFSTKGFIAKIPTREIYTGWRSVLSGSMIILSFINTDKKNVFNACYNNKFEVYLWKRLLDSSCRRPSCFMLQKLEISPSLMGHLAPMQTYCCLMRHLMLDKWCWWHGKSDQPSYQFHMPLCEWVCRSISAVSFKSEYFLRTASCPAVRSQIFGDLHDNKRRVNLIS